MSGAYAIRELNLAVSDEIFDRLWKGTLKDEPWYLPFVGPFGWLVKLWPARRTEWAQERSLEWGKYQEQNLK